MAEYVTLKKADGTVIYPQSVIAQVAEGSISGSQIDWSTCNVIIDSSPTASTFFGGSYSKTFTVPEDGYYEISTPFSCVAHRTSNAQAALYVAIDNSTKFTYSYMSTSGDTEWGTNRRTIGSASFIVALTAGQHTLSTSGNLYYDSSLSAYTTISSFYAKYFAPSS